VAKSFAEDKFILASLWKVTDDLRRTWRSNGKFFFNVRVRRRLFNATDGPATPSISR